jgi:hypothetical protein
MRKLAATACCVLAAGCAGRSPLFGAEAPASRPRGECRYLNVLVDYSRDAAGMSSRDVQLAAQVAETMAKELERLGARVTEEPGQAYWSLMLMAIHNERDGGFIFSATLALRQLSESRDPGIATYAKPEDESAPASLYTAISYGSLEDVERLARIYVQKADAALLPSARQLCAYEGDEEQRHDSVEAQVPDPALPL